MTDRITRADLTAKATLVSDMLPSPHVVWPEKGPGGWAIVTTAGRGQRTLTPGRVTAREAARFLDGMREALLTTNEALLTTNAHLVNYGQPLPWSCYECGTRTDTHAEDCPPVPADLS